MVFGFNEVTLSQLSKSSNIAASENLETQYFSLRSIQGSCDNLIDIYLYFFTVSLSFQDKMFVDCKTMT